MYPIDMIVDGALGLSKVVAVRALDALVLVQQYHVGYEGTTPWSLRTLPSCVSTVWISLSIVFESDVGLEVGLCGEPAKSQSGYLLSPVQFPSVRHQVLR